MRPASETKEFSIPERDRFARWRNARIGRVADDSHAKPRARRVALKRRRVDATSAAPGTRADPDEHHCDQQAPKRRSPHGHRIAVQRTRRQSSILDHTQASGILLIVSMRACALHDFRATKSVIIEEVQMKRTYLLLLGALGASAACASMPPSGSAAGDLDIFVATPSAAELDAAYTSSTLDISSRIATLDRYRRSIEQRLPGADFALAGATTLTKRAVTLPAHAFSDVTREEWATMETFYDRNELKRLRLIPPAGAKPETEEFYFNNGNLVFVYYEPDGAGKSERHVESGGDAFYFGSEGLIAWVRSDGSRVDPNKGEFKYWASHLLKEAARFSRGA